MLRKGGWEVLQPRQPVQRPRGGNSTARGGIPYTSASLGNKMRFGEQGGFEDSVWREVRQRGGWLLAPKIQEPARGHTARKQQRPAREPWLWAGGGGQGPRAFSGPHHRGI